MSLNPDTWLKPVGFMIAGNVGPFTVGSPNVLGSGTAFLSTFQPGDLMRTGSGFSSLYMRVLSITDDTHMIMTAPYPSNPGITSGFKVSKIIPITGDDGVSYNLECPALEVGNTLGSGGSVLVPGPAVAAVQALITPFNWSAAIPITAPAVTPPPANDTLLDAGAPADVTVTGQDGVIYRLVTYADAQAENVCLVPRMAVNAALALGWTIE